MGQMGSHCTPQKMWGMGDEFFYCFSQALASKLGWQMITSDNLWIEVVIMKYIIPLPIEEWIRLPTWNKLSISTI